MRLDALYVVVQDMAAARVFYAQVFNQEPTLVDERFSGFDLGGTLFGLFAARFLDEPVDTRGLIYGTNCVANIRVDDADAEHGRIAKLNPPHLTVVQQSGPYRLFQLEDPDSNRVEFYQATGVAD